jgi:MerR family transcriptional regulator, thiopeptide resistance regulator
METTRLPASRRIGDVATATGLTVRTLHYYEEIGLLVPSSRSGAGHRLYSTADVERLYRIGLLRRLGFPLAEIGRILDDSARSLQAAIGRHLEALHERQEAIAHLRARLGELLKTIAAGEDLAIEGLLDVVEEMTMLDSTVQRRISYLVYTDLEAAYEHLVRVFGLGPGELTRDADGRVVHGELQAGDGVIWLHPESPQFGLASPRTAGAATAGTAVMVEDVDAHFRHAVEQGATIEYDPVDQPYGYREYSARDSEGGLWSFMKPLD